MKSSLHYFTLVNDLVIIVNENQLICFHENFTVKNDICQIILARDKNCGTITLRKLSYS